MHTSIAVLVDWSDQARGVIYRRWISVSVDAVQDVSNDDQGDACRNHNWSYFDLFGDANHIWSLLGRDNIWVTFAWFRETGHLWAKTNVILEFWYLWSLNKSLDEPWSSKGEKIEISDCNLLLNQNVRLIFPLKLILLLVRPRAMVFLVCLKRIKMPYNIP